MAKDKTTFHVAEGYGYFAQVFKENRDLAKGTDDQRVKRARQKVNGLYKLSFYPKDEENMAKMQEALSDPMFGGHPRWKKGEDDVGTGQYTMLTRKHEDPSGYENLGGPPEVVYFMEGKHNEDWSFMEDGPLWNGFECIVKYTTYGEGDGQTVRLVKVGVKENGEPPEDYDPDGPRGF